MRQIYVQQDELHKQMEYTWLMIDDDADDEPTNLTRVAHRGAAIQSNHRQHLNFTIHTCKLAIIF
jgi:hypothetical protein